MTTDSRISLDRFAAYGETVKARALVRELLNLGLRVSVNDGEEWTVKQSDDRMTILAALCTTGTDRLRVRHTDGTVSGEILLVWGNAHDGSELVADYSTKNDPRLEALLARM